MKQSTTRGSGILPDGKLARGDSSMADSSLYEETIEDSKEETETSATEPNLKDIHNIQSAISDMQGTIAALLKENNKLSGDVADLRHIIAKNNDEVEKLKEDFIKQNQYVASLELKLEYEKKASKQQRSDIQELQESLDELEQYSRKNSVEIYGIPEDIGISTDEVVCKVASPVVFQIAPENIEISHRFYRKKGTKPIIAKFPNHKDKAKLYKARVQLKNLTLSALFLSYSATGLARQRICINENLTSYRSDMMKLAIEKRKDGKILSTWSLDGKIFIKTFPGGRPRQMFLIEQIKELCFRFFFLFQPSCYCSTSSLSLEKRELIA